MLKYMKLRTKWNLCLSRKRPVSVILLKDGISSRFYSTKWFKAGLSFGNFGRRHFSISSAKHRNLYSILQVSPNATQEEIKKSYYKLSFKYHPDRNKGKESTIKQFQEISEAYAVLGDVEERTKYDRQYLSVESPSVGTVSPKKPGNSKIVYNFDEWHKKHYEEARLRKQRAIRESRLYNKQTFVQHQESDIYNEKLTFWFLGALILVLMFMAYRMDKKRDDEYFELATKGENTQKAEKKNISTNK